MYAVLEGVLRGHTEASKGLCLVNNAELGAVRNVERDRNERVNAAWLKGAARITSGTCPRAVSFGQGGWTYWPGDCLWDFRPVNPETEPRCLPIASLWTQEHS